jgi:hypothetical protein
VIVARIGPEVVDMERPEIRLSATVLGCPDPIALGEFYARLLGWTVRDRDPGWVTVRPPSGGPGLSFQREADFDPPAWPARPGAPRLASHLDIEVTDLDAAVARAVGLGARPAAFQPQQQVRVMLDPAGQVFCLFDDDDGTG